MAAFEQGQPSYERRRPGVDRIRSIGAKPVAFIGSWPIDSWGTNRDAGCVAPPALWWKPRCSARRDDQALWSRT